MQIKLRKLVSASILAVSGVGLSINGYAESKSYRDARYCEVVVGHGLKAAVFTSFNLNKCPQNLWRHMDSRLIKRQEKATFVYLNGPRYFLVDDYKIDNVGGRAASGTFGGMKMHKSGEVKITFSDILKGFRPYREHTVYRKNLWVFKAGRPIYELISPKNKVYVMQSYSGEVIQQNEKSLAKLGSKLSLPKGWRFKTGIIDKEVHLSTVNQRAILTQDNFKNTYQLAPKDYLAKS